MDTRLVTKQIRIQQWAGIIKSRVESGLTINEYCNANGLTKHQYYYWLKKVREAAIEESGLQFIEVPQEDETLTCSQEGSIQIQIGNATVNVNDGTSRKLLQMVLEVAGNVQ